MIFKGFLGLIFGVSCGVGFAQTWDLAQDFSIASNPNGAWSYGALVNGAFVPAASSVTGQFSFWLTAAGHGVVGKNIGGYYDYGILPGHATLEADADIPAAVWTAPFAGIFNVSVQMGGSTASGPGGFGNRAAHLARLEVNGWDQTPDSFVGNVKSWDRPGLALAAGEQVVAWVGQQWGGGNTDTTFVVTAVPEPASWATLGLGAFLLRRRGKR